MSGPRRVYLMARFPSPATLCDGARAVRALGWTDLDAHSPYPIHGVADALALARSRVPSLVLLAGLSGATLGYLLQWWTNAVDYVLDVGGRPPHAPPLFVPITFELGVLLAACTAFFAVLALSGLPRPYHPVFRVAGFARASLDQLWLSVRSDVGIDEDVLAALRAAGAAETTWIEDDA